MKIIRKRERIDETYYEHHFDFPDHNSGYSVPCDKDGNVQFNTDAARKNYNRCISGEIPDLMDCGIITKEQSYLQHAVGICDHCGQEITLQDEFCGACQCQCGQWYSINGQALLPPEQWQETIEPEDYY